MRIKFNRKALQQKMPEAESNKRMERRDVVFRKDELKESAEELGNPGCGWYHVYTFTAQPSAGGRTVEEEIWLDEACRKEQLALVIIDIGAF